MRAADLPDFFFFPFRVAWLDLAVSERRISGCSLVGRGASALLRRVASFLVRATRWSELDGVLDRGFVRRSSTFNFSRGRAWRSGFGFTIATASLLLGEVALSGLLSSSTTPEPSSIVSLPRCEVGKCGAHSGVAYEAEPCQRALQLCNIRLGLVRMVVVTESKVSGEN